MTALVRMMPTSVVLFDKLVGDEWWGCPRCFEPKFPVKPRKKATKNDEAKALPPEQTFEQKIEKPITESTDTDQGNVVRLMRQRSGGRIEQYGLQDWWQKDFDELEREYIRDIHRYHDGRERDDADTMARHVILDSGFADAVPYDEQTSTIDGGDVPQRLLGESAADFLFQKAQSIWSAKGESGYGVDLALRFLEKAATLLEAGNLAQRFVLGGFKVECLRRILKDDQSHAVRFEAACRDLIQFTKDKDMKKHFRGRAARSAGMFLASPPSANAVVHPGYLRLARHLEDAGRLEEAVELYEEAASGGWAGAKWDFNISRLRKKLGAVKLPFPTKDHNF
ncbi:hypothetical protein ACFQX9_22610 [Bradyrhizobium sp. GCM10028915]|uniref:hypothetical protein n=1 Tax=Bradyrhizobium sp. GCM10028915 TaxID=3273385 RepID=UPI0036218C04